MGAGESIVSLYLSMIGTWEVVLHLYGMRVYRNEEAKLSQTEA